MNIFAIYYIMYYVFWKIFDKYNNKTCHIQIRIVHYNV